MLLVALSWIYILFTTVSCGIVFAKLFRLSSNIIVTFFLGFFGISLVATFWAFFIRIHFEFHILLIALSVFSAVVNRNRLVEFKVKIQNEIKNLSLSLKILLFVMLLLTLAQSASAPFTFDNESYYIQNIKWLNEYGFVKGLANLHIFLAQSSAWTVTQSVFSLSFLYDRFNDINGFSLFVFNGFCVLKLSRYFRENHFSDLLIGIFPFANLLLFPFISAPSPDLPIYLITVLIAYYLIHYYYEMSVETFQVITILTLFALFIKTTSFVLALIPIVLFVINFKRYSQKVVPISILSALVLIAFLVKNSILSGYPLYPLTTFSIDADYTVPRIIVEHITEFYNAKISRQNRAEFTTIELFLNWLKMPKLDGFFNILSVAIVLVSPFLIVRFFNKKPIWILYFTMCVQLIILFVAAPQYRFFLNFTIVFTLFFAALLLSKRHNFLLPILYFSTFFVAIYVFVPLNIGNLSNTKLITETTTFKLEHIIFPDSNSRFPLTYKDAQIGNLKYNSPHELKYIYITGNGDLPCVKTSQIKYFNRKFEYIPQQRTTNLKDGFYAKSTK